MSDYVHVERGLLFRHRSAEGWDEMRVVHRDTESGYWVCAFNDGPRREAVWVRSEREIQADAVATMRADAAHAEGPARMTKVADMRQIMH
jgi:hypothetical protein